MVTTRSQAVARIADRTAWKHLCGSRDVMGHVTILKPICSFLLVVLRKLLGIKWYHHVRNDEVRRTTGQPRLSAIVQARRLSLFGHIARMPDETDARSIITASPSEDWRRPLGRPRTTWMKTIQQDLRSNNLSLDEAITVAQNRPLWRLMLAFGATHP